jgi:hypothetical protein
MGSKPLNQNEGVKAENLSNAQLVADIIAFAEMRSICTFYELADELATFVNMHHSEEKEAKKYVIFGQDPELYLNAFIKNTQFFQAYFVALNEDNKKIDDEEEYEEECCPCDDDDFPPFDDEDEDEDEGEDYIGKYADDDLVKEINLQNYIKKLKEDAKNLLNQVEDINKEVFELSSKIVAGKKPETIEEVTNRVKHSSLIELGIQKQEMARKMIEIAYDLANIVFGVQQEEK